MPTPELNLDKDPDFIEDMYNENLTNREIVEKWGCGNGYVGDRRARIRRGLPMVADPVEDGDVSEVTENDDGTKTFKFIRHRPVTLEDARALIRSSGDDPALYNVAIKSIAYGGDKSSNKISAWPKAGVDLVKAVPLTHMYAEAAKLAARDSFGISRDPRRATVVNVADMQLGKVGRRGGTPETLARLERKREALREEMIRRAPSRILIADLGDGIEGFESGGNPMFTNDLSLPDQIEAYATELFKFISLAVDFAPVDVTVVASNHSAWRNGKQVLGKPSDDWGIHVHKRIEQLCHELGLDVTWTYPADYDESVRVELLGVPLGFVHGNQFGPGKAIEWWQKQAFGGQAVAHADVLVSGHYHAFGAGVAGTNPATGRERMWYGAPTLDNGSDWFRQVAGRDSEPGLFIFDVSPEGLLLGSANIL